MTGVWREDLYKRGQQKNKGQFAAKGGAKTATRTGKRGGAEPRPADKPPLSAGQKAAVTRAANKAAAAAAAAGKSPAEVHAAARSAAHAEAGTKPTKPAATGASALTPGQKAAATKAANKAAVEAAAAGKPTAEVHAAARQAAVLAKTTEPRSMTVRQWNQVQEALGAMRDMMPKGQKLRPLQSAGNSNVLLAMGGAKADDVLTGVNKVPQHHLNALPPMVIGSVPNFRPWQETKADFVETAGLYMRSEDSGMANTIVIPDRVIDPDGTMFDVDDHTQAVVHEIGHAVTELMPDRDRRKLVDAVQADAKQLTAKEREAAQHFLDSDVSYAEGTAAEDLEGKKANVLITPEEIAELYSARHSGMPSFGGLSPQRCRKVFGKSMVLMDGLLDEAAARKIK